MRKLSITHKMVCPNRHILASSRIKKMFQRFHIVQMFALSVFLSLYCFSSFVQYNSLGNTIPMLCLFYKIVCIFGVRSLF